MPETKMLAEWFWVDRWVGSSAFGLNIAARGLYREMLSQAWRRGAELPNDHDQIRRICAVTRAEWKRTWPFIERFWRVDGDRLVNDTQLEVYAEAQGRKAAFSARGRKGAAARYDGGPSTPQAETKRDVGSAQAVLKHQPPISDHQSPIPPPQNGGGAPLRPSGGSKRPVFTGNRLTLFEWQWDSLQQLLGPHGTDFDVMGWLDTVDRQTATVLPAAREARWAWLQQQLVDEAKRRGLPIAGASPLSARGQQNAAAMEEATLAILAREARHAAR